MEPVYRRVLGPRFSELPAAVQALHDVRAPQAWKGACAVTRGTSLFARIACGLGGLPPATEREQEDFRFTVRPDEDGEVWSRGFPGLAPFTSRQWAGDRDGLLYERALPLTFAFKVETGADGLVLKLKRGWFLGVPVPRALLLDVAASEAALDGVFRFDVAARFPWGALLVQYRGWLKPA